MNDSYVATRLNQWAQWVMRRNDGGIGYPKKVPYINFVDRSEFGSSTPELQEDCFDVEKCVMAVRVVNNELHEVIYLAYIVNNMTIEQKLKLLGCCKQTYYNRLDRAHHMVLGYLNDLAAGINLPHLELNIKNVAVYA